MVSSFSAQTLFPLQFHPPLRLKVVSAHSSSSSQQPSPSPENTDAKALRGSDILQALHRATAAATPKGKKKKNKKNMTRPQPNSSQQQLLYDDDDIRPINIRSDWEGRIAELETRLQQLQSQYHY